MKRITAFSIFFLTALAAFSYCDEQKKADPNQLFYAGNGLYEKREYQKAIETYLKVQEAGMVSPSLYFNIGNCYFKAQDLGRAILYYERAKRLAPQDADIKSNLTYAKSLVGSSSPEMTKAGLVASLIRRPFEDFNLNAIAISTLALYLAVILAQMIFFMNRLVAKRLRIIYFALLVIFTGSISAFALRYYDEEILKHAVILDKDLECKYEPIDKSMTYYKLQEGDEVTVLKTRDGWSQIERPDGKVGWAPEPAAEEI